MAVYALLDRTAIEDLAHRFGIDDMTDFQAMDGGSENTSYRIATSSGDYVLTICDQKSLQHTTRLASILVYLSDHGIRTSRVVSPPDEPIVVLHDDKPVMLKRHIDGEIRSNLSGNILLQLGEEMSRLHQLPAPSYLPESFSYGRNYFSQVTDSDLDHSYVDWLAEKSDYLAKHIPGSLPLALIHGDLFFDNVIVRDDELMALIDFEEACHYYRNFDLGMAIIGSCREDQTISFAKARSLVRGYQKEITLQPAEQESLQAFAVYAAVATSFWRFRHYNLRRPDPALFDRHVEMQALADTISAYPDSSFAELFE